jgi:hypothetical protein
LETDSPQEQTPEQGRPKIISVSAPSVPPLTKPRIIAQAATNQQPISGAEARAASARQEPGQQNAPSSTSNPMPQRADPATEAEWAEQTLSQAERDAEEQRMASDIAQELGPVETAQGKNQHETPTEGPTTPKAEPKSVPGLFYAIRGIADSISRKLAGK